MSRRFKARKKEDDSFESVSVSRKSRRIAFVILTAFAVIMLIPLFWIFISAFKVDREVIQAGGFLFFPKTWTLENIAALLTTENKQLPIINIQLPLVWPGV